MLERLNDMIQERYGKGFSVRRIAAVGTEKDLAVHLENKDLYIPIIVKDVFLGFGLVHEAQDLSHEQQDQLSKLVRMVLEPELYTEHLERTLHNLQIEKEVAQESRTTSNEKLIFVYGQSSHRVQKIALDIHEIADNFSYLPIHDILSEVKKAEDLVDLKGTTLVIDLERALSDEAQALIVQYIEKSLKGPLLIFSSSRPTYQLIEEGRLQKHLLQLIQPHEFSVDRLPVDKVMLRDVLEMMYFDTQTEA